MSPFFISHMHRHVVLPVEKSRHTCSVLTTYLKDNTDLFMYTYTVNKILNIKLSLWQM